MDFNGHDFILRLSEMDFNGHDFIFKSPDETLFEVI